MAVPLKRSSEERPLPPVPPLGTLGLDDGGDITTSPASIQMDVHKASIAEILGPLLRQPPTPRSVSFVVPEHRMSACSANIYTVSDKLTLAADGSPVRELPLDFGEFSLDLPRKLAPALTSTFKQSREMVSPPSGSTAHREDEKTEVWPHQTKRVKMVNNPATVRQGGPHKSRLMQGLRGVRGRIWTPVGVLSSIYGLLIIGWGAAVFFLLIGWTSLPSYQRYQWIEIGSQVLTALFAITGIGFIPWRVRDSYHIMIIADYSRLARVREKRQLVRKTIGEQPPNEMSDILPSSAFERALLQQQESTVILVLTERERRHLRKSVRVLAKSKTWFRPLGSVSHRATSFGVVASIIMLNDLNSVFQCVLCGFMWFVSPMKRPLWVLGLTITGAILTTLVAGILIAISSLRATNNVGKNTIVFDQWRKKEESAHDAGFVG